MKRVVTALRKIDNVMEYLIFDCIFGKRWRRKAVTGLVGMGITVWALSSMFSTFTPKELIQQGDKAWFANNNVKGARKLYRQAYRQNKKDFRALLRIGHTYRSQQRFKKALRYYRKAYDRSQNLVTEFRLGEAYTHLKRPHIALGFLNATLSKAPSFPPALCYQGRAFDELKNYPRALHSFQKALKASRSYPGTYFYRGITFINLKQYDAAIRDFKDALALNPEEAAAIYNIACAYSLKKDAPKSLVWLEKAFKKGFREFKHMKKDKDLDFIRKQKGYSKLLKRFR